MRLFVAVDVPDTLRNAIEEQVVEPLRRTPGAKWTRPEGRHLTLEFLGNVDDERLPEITAALRTVGPKHAAFDAAFTELGGFPNLRRPRVLWVGIGTGAEPMAKLAADVELAFGPLGFEAEGRPFTPHLTLARFAKPRVIEELPPVGVPDERFVVDEFVLFESQLHPKGARYRAVERFPLSA